MLLNRNFDVNPFFINYGQLNYHYEWNSCQKVCKFYGLKPIKIDISNYGTYIKSGITSKELDVYNKAFLPNRNLLFLLIASSYAFQNEIYAIAIGLIKNPIFPDQTKDFIQKAEECIQESLEVDIKIIAPMIDLDKIDVYRLANELQVPIDLTYYCHKGQENPCGECIACKEHIQAKNIMKEKM